MLKQTATLSYYCSLAKAAQSNCDPEGNVRIIAALRNTVVSVYHSSVVLISNSVNCKQIHEFNKFDLERKNILVLGCQISCKKQDCFDREIKKLKSHIQQNLRYSVSEARCTVLSSQSRRASIQEKHPSGGRRLTSPRTLRLQTGAQILFHSISIGAVYI